MEFTTDKLVAAYRKIRTAIEEKEEEHKQELAPLKEKRDLVAAKLLEICEAQNADSIKTQEGTVTRRVATRYWTNDWESMHRFIQEHDALHLLEQRIHVSNMQQFLQENPDTCPAGLQAERKYVLTVRKPSNK